MSKFQLFILIGFGLIILVSVFIFSRYKGGGGTQAQIEIWGTLSNNDFYNLISQTSLNNNKNIQVTYEEKDADKFSNDLLEALAAGKGPDLFMLPQDEIYKQKNKITLIPYTMLSERDFKNSYIEGAEIFLDEKGIVAMPFLSDPLVMYWNRDIFNQNKISMPPKYWDELYNLAGAITKKDSALNITKSAVAFGEFSNVTNAKAIISNLLMQSGTPITSPVAGGQSVLGSSFDKPILPAEAAINFYTEFSNPVKPFYSWNRSLPDAKEYFLSGDLAVYFGFASELSDLQRKNPNLNFDVAYMPTSREGGVYVSYANFVGLAVSKTSMNPIAAFQTASVLASAEGQKAMESALNLPPIRRDLLAAKPANPYQDVFYGSTLRAKAWLDPDPAKSTAIFKEMIESITSGRDRTSTAVTDASNQLSSLFQNNE